MHNYSVTCRRRKEANFSTTKAVWIVETLEENVVGVEGVEEEEEEENATTMMTVDPRTKNPVRTVRS